MGIELVKWIIIGVLTVGGIVLIAMDKIDTTAFITMLGGAAAIFGLGKLIQKGNPKS